MVPAPQVVIALLTACLKEEFTDSVKEAWIWLWTFLTRSLIQVRRSDTELD